MKNEHEVVVRKEWVEVALEIVRFFLHHSTIEFDGKAQKAKVRYQGPKGWNVSVDTSFSPEFQICNKEETDLP